MTFFFCSYSIVITTIKRSSAPSGAYTSLRCSFLGVSNYSLGSISDSKTLTSNFYYLCLRNNRDSYIAITNTLGLAGNSLPAIKMSSGNYDFQASAKIAGEYYGIKF